MQSLVYPFLVSDMDGTLLNDAKEISAENKEGIALFREKGGFFTLATGRSYPESKKYIRELKLSCPVILYNGAMIYDPATDQLNPVSLISDSLMVSILKDLEQKLPSSIDIFVYGIDKIYGTKVGDLTKTWADADFSLEMLPSFHDLPADVVSVKIVAVADKEAMEHLIQWSQTIRHLPVECVLSADHYFEILPAGASKGNALLKVLKTLKLSPTQAVAIGDHLNDLSMFQIAGLSAAVKNAHPSAQKQAQLIVPSNNESAVAHLIRHHLLPAFSQTS
jgi:Cof subfamily protein (haloacid dehalogenase superfamily)